MMGYGTHDPASAAHIYTLAGAFGKGFGVIREHAPGYFQVIVLANRNRLVKLIISDLTDRSS